MLLYYMSIFESMKQLLCYAFEQLEDLQIYLHTNSQIISELADPYFKRCEDVMILGKRQDLLKKFSYTLESASDKIAKYIWSSYN